MSPLVLRGGGASNVRLSFIPTLVSNAKNVAASVKGVLCYQKKRSSDLWENCEAIPLSSLRVGDGVRLELDTSETLALYRGLDEMYRLFASTGIVPGQRKYEFIDDRSPLARFRAAIPDDQTVDTVEAVLGWLANEDFEKLAAIATRQPSGTLGKLDAAVGTARLRSFLARARDLLSSPPEGAWQSLLTAESWAVSQLFAAPLILIRGQAYLGGKSVENQGGTIADFLYRTSHTGASLLVEIKTSTVSLTIRDTYARNNSINVSPAVTGGVQQLLGDRDQMMHDYYSLTRGSRGEMSGVDPQMLLIIGNTSLLDDDEKVSFDRFRRSLRNVQIIGFDEVITKTVQLLELLSEA